VASASVPTEARHSAVERRQVVDDHVRVRGLSKVEAEGVVAVIRGVDQREWRRRRAVKDVPLIDAALGQPRLEQSTEGVVGQATDECHGNAEPPQRHCSVVRPAPGIWMKSVVVFEEVDQRLSGDGYHRLHAATGSISPEPRGTS
jgi:hypothetical protein